MVVRVFYGAETFEHKEIDVATRLMILIIVLGMRRSRKILNRQLVCVILEISVNFL